MTIGDHSATEKSGAISLTAGQKYPIKLEFYENQGVASVKLLWSSNYQAKAVIPQSQLYSETVPPTTTCDYQADGAWVKNPVAIRLTAQDNDSGVFQTYYQINNDVDTVGNTITISTDGIYNIKYWAVDNAGNVEQHHSLTVKIDQTGPELAATQTPAPNANGWNNGDVTVTFAANDVGSGVKTVSSSVTITQTGLNQTVNGTAEDQAGNQSALTYAVSIDKDAPLITNLQPQGTINNLRPTISAMITDDLAGIDLASVIMKVDGAIVTAVASESGVAYAPTAAMTNGRHTVTVGASDKAGNVALVGQTTFTIDATLPNLPPDPATVAPTLDPTIVADLKTATSFLYSGENPIQTGVDPETIEAKRAAVIKGKVLNKSEQPLPGVKITVLGHPEYGYTISRADGQFDMAVNGGGLLTVKYERTGFLSAQRKVNIPWQDFSGVPDVILIPVDSQVTAITTNSQDGQVARGSVISDERGQRQGTIFFPPGTQTVGLAGATIHVRATEFTVGVNGPKTMPATLPPTSGYTYCVELSADEAESVQFNQPIYAYVENFINFPVGGIVPSGYYDQAKGVWVPSENGRVIKIIGINNGLADIDVTGNGQAADAQALSNLGFADVERQRLATTYAIGQSLWRVPIKHFSIYDFNWPFGFPLDAITPVFNVAKIKKSGDPTTCEGSIIEMQNQILGEVVSIPGVDSALHYSSDRMDGYVDDRTIKVSLIGEKVPASLKRIELKISVAGQIISKQFTAQPNSEFQYIWDGKDSYGRAIVGSQKAVVEVGYIYPAVYQTPDSTPSFGMLSGVSIDGLSPMTEIASWKTDTIEITSRYDKHANLGGWSLSNHHSYDPIGHILYLGNGTRSSNQDARLGVKPYIGGLNATGFAGDNGSLENALLDGPNSIKFGPDGCIYIADTGNQRIRKIDKNGIITTIAGTGKQGTTRDGGPAVQADLFNPKNLAIAPDGSVYFINGYSVRKIYLDGVIDTVAGNGIFPTDFSLPEGQVAKSTSISPSAIAIDNQGILYIADQSRRLVLRIGFDGIIHVVAGILNDQRIYGDNGPAKKASVGYGILSMVFGPDNCLYFNQSNFTVRRIGMDGIITTVVGDGTKGSEGNDIGGLATKVKLYGPNNLTFDKDGNLFIADSKRILKVGTDQYLKCVSGIAEPYYVSTPSSGDNGPAGLARFKSIDGISVDWEGAIYVCESLSSYIRFIKPVLPDFSATDLLIPSEDGSELFHFNPNGKHLRTLDTLTGKVKYAFNYDVNGRLISVVALNNNTTTIERDGGGNPTAIVGPFGQRTVLAVDSAGYLQTVTNAANESYRCTYYDGGLLHTFTDPKGGVHTFTYDENGLLTRDEDPDGGYTALSRTETEKGRVVRSTKGKDSQAAYITDYSIEVGSNGAITQATSGCCGGTRKTVYSTDFSETTTAPDGTVTKIQKGADPRFAMQAPIISSLQVATPSGKTYSLTTSRTVTLNDPDNILSVKTLTDTTTINSTKTFTSAYDATTHTLTNTTPMGRKSVTTLDDQGRVIKVETPGLAPVAFVYDDWGRLYQITEGAGSTARISKVFFKSNGYIDYVLDPLNRKTSFEYDPVGRVTKQTLPNGKVIAFNYDANGNVTNLTPPDKGAHNFTYTPADLADTYNPPLLDSGATTTQYDYNLAKQPTLVTRPDDKTIGLAYNTQGKLIGLQLPEGELTYAYDANTGQLKNIIAPDNGTITNAYDGALPTAVTWAGLIQGKVGVTYNSDFLVDSQSVNDGNKVSYQYNNDGQLTNAGDLSINYDATTGMYTGSTIGNISDAVVSRTEFGEVKNYKVTSNGTNRFETQYTYDALGRIQTKTETVDGQNHAYEYSYDEIGQLTDVKKDGALVGHYEYDSNGNRTSYSGVNGSVGSTQYDAQDRLIKYGNNSYQYSANGELQSKTNSSGTTRYEYDVLGNLKSVTLADGTRLEYVVDGAGRRIGKKVNGALIQGFLYQDDLKPVVELDGSNNVVARFVYGTRSIVPDYMIKGGITYRIVSDHLGSVRMVVDVSTGQVVQKMDYDEFGNVLQDTNPGFQPFGFAGGLYDKDTKLVRFGARDYDPEIGRWTKKDPIGFDGGDSNLYVYCGNEPINQTDNEGLSVGAPGLGEGMIPVWGSGRAAINDFQEGRSGWGVVNTGMAVSDVFLVKAVVTGIAKGGLKIGGSYAWGAARKYYGKTGFAESGQALHHWLIPQGTWGKEVPNWLKNQMPNLMPMTSRGFHNAVHGWGPNAYNGLQRLWYGTPQWFKALGYSIGSRFANGLKGNDCK